MIEVNQNVNCERLYLQREDKNDIFLDNCHIIKQHQIEGLRFLFKQFKKVKKLPIFEINLVFSLQFLQNMSILTPVKHLQK